MKILIWVAACFVYGLYEATMIALGIQLGAIPSILVLGALLALAVYFCRKYDYYLMQKGKISVEDILIDIPHPYREKLEEARGNAIEVRKIVDMIVDRGYIDRKYFELIVNEYRSSQK